MTLHLRRTGRRELPLEPDEPSNEELAGALDRVLTLLREATGHDFGEYKRGPVLRRLRRRLQQRRVDSVAAYLDVLENDPDEPQQLTRDLLIGVTHFFRDPDVFELLGEQVLPTLVSRAHDDDLRIWVAGCASGEEVYSLGILVHEQLTARGLSRRVRLFATDIDADTIAEARTARYTKEIAEHVSPERLARYFIDEGETFRVGPDVRDMCVFSEHSLIRDPPFLQIDLLSCRNVLIYMDVELQRRLIPLFHFALRPGGYLLLGTSEGLPGPQDLFEVLDKRHRLFRRLETVTPSKTGVHAAPPMPRATQSSPPPLPPVREPQAFNLTFERLLLQEYTPPSVVVSRSGDIICVAGPTGRYLQPSAGVFSNNVLDIAQANLRIEIRTALHTASHTGAQVVREAVPIEIDGTPRWLRLIVRPLPGARPSDMFVVVLQEYPDVTPPAAVVAEDGERGWALEQLEQELRTTRASLNATIDELQTANEQLRSFNEELESSNEELQSSEEELRSVNEELTAVNAELDRKVEEVEQVNSDLHHLLCSTDVATLFLDSEQRLLRATPAARTLFRLLDGDVGRPLADLAFRFADHDLSADITEVLGNLEALEREVETLDRRTHFLLRVLPYRGPQGRVLGAVVTLADITRIKRAEAGVRRLATVVLDSNDAVTVQDLAGNILDWNRGAEQIYGYTAAEARSMNIAALVPPDERAQLQDILAVSARGERVRQHEVRRVRKRGDIVHVWLTVTPLLDDQGRPTGLATTERDITEARRAEQIVRADHEATTRLLRIGSMFIQEGSLAAVLDEVVDATVAVCGADFGNIQVLDPASHHLVIVAQRGFSSEWLDFWRDAHDGAGACGAAIVKRERIIIDDVEADPPPVSPPVLAAYRAQGARAAQSTPLLGRTGALVGVLSTYTRRPGRPDERTLRHLDLFARQAADILETSRAHDALRHSEARLRALVEASSEVLYRMSPDWREVREVYSPGSLAGAEGRGRAWLDDYIPPEAHDQFFAAVDDAITSGRGFSLEHPSRRADGTLGWSLSRAVPLRDADGAIVEWFGAATDITDRKLAELAQGLAEANERLREADRRKDDFLGMLSHELRNPLVPIRNSLRLLAHTPPGGEQARRSQAVIERQVSHLTRLVEDLLDITRISRGKIELHRERVDLGELVRRTVEDHQCAFSDNGVALELVGATGEIPIDGDPIRLVQVLGNLLHNAAKFTPRGGKATFAVAVDEGRQRVSVRITDSGRGIPPDLLPHVFDPFTQGDAELDRGQGGLGLGLSLVKTLVEMHGGTVEAASAGEGTGSSFTIILPLARAAPPARAPAGPMRAAPRRRVLLVEDNVDAADTLGELLTLAGHTVTVVYNGDDGLAAIPTCDPEVVFCDIGLPGMTGYEFARAVRADPARARLRLIALSGYARPSDIARAREAGFDAHVAKPPSLETLEQLLARADR